MKLRKISGEEETFDKNKFCGSLKKAGAPDDLTSFVCAEVEKGLRPGITTTDIFRKASQILIEKNLHVAARYNLKRGIRDLGPAGFHFERYAEVLLQTLGYETRRGQQVQGFCVSHEIDVTARKGDKHYVVEVKYHNMPGIKVHIDVVMYGDARGEDIARREHRDGLHEATHSLWVITNTKFTEKAVSYAKCRNILLMGWRYPAHEGLEDIITRFRLFPVTVLPSVDPQTLEIFASRDMMLAQDIAPYTKDDLVRKFSVHPGRAEAIHNEARTLLYGDEAAHG